MATCYIAGAGEFTTRGLHPQPDDFVIAADGGYTALQAAGIKPNLLMGDLDSLGVDVFLPPDLALERFPVEKDDTDTGIALAHGWSLGYRDFALYGCSGGRIDHLLANFQSMGRYSRMGASIRLVDENYIAYALTNGSLTLPKRPAGSIVSIFCHGSTAEGVSLRGLYYPLENHTLTADFPLGVSNQHTDETAQIHVDNGTLIVIQY